MFFPTPKAIHNSEILNGSETAIAITTTSVSTVRKSTFVNPFERRLRGEPSSFYLPPRGYKEKGCLRHPEADCKGLVGQNLGIRCGSPKMEIVSFYFHSLEEIHASCWAAWLMI